MKKNIYKKGFALLLTVILAAAAVLGGCGSDSSSAAGSASDSKDTPSKTSQSPESGDSAELTKLRVAIMTNGFDHYTTLIGQWKGFFEKNGLELEITEYGRGINTIDAVVNGTADVGNMATYATVNRLGNTLHDTDLVIFSEQSHGGVQNGGLYVAPEYEGNLEALDGSKGFISIIGTVSDYQTSAAIEYLGLDEASQNIIAADSLSTCLALVQTNDASAIYTSGSTGARVEALGWKLAVPSSELNLIDGGFFLTTKSFNENNTETLAKFLTGLQESFEYIKANMDECAEYIESQIGLSADDFKANWESLNSAIGFSEEGAQDLETLEKWGYEHGKYDEDYDVRQFINTDAAKLAFPDRVTVKE